MSACIILTPIVISTWPMITAAITAAAASAGFSVEKQPEKKAAKAPRRCELDLKNVDVVADSMARDDQMVVQRQGVRVIFSRDGRGHFQTTVEGDLPKEELERIGQELAGEVVQQYVYRRLSQELAQQGFVTLEEEKGPDQSIHIQVRRYEE